MRFFAELGWSRFARCFSFTHSLTRSLSFGYRPWVTAEILFFIRLVAQGTKDEPRSEERDTQHRETPTTTTTIATTKVTAGGKDMAERHGIHDCWRCTCGSNLCFLLRLLPEIC
jgi:hypothetical protein